MAAPWVGSQDDVAVRRVSETRGSRNLSFRCTEFSETQSVLLLILEAPICRVFLYAADRGYGKSAGYYGKYLLARLPLRGLLGNWGSGWGSS
jgi:hypothetical protein